MTFAGLGRDFSGDSASKAGLVQVLKTRKMVFFSEAPFGEAALNQACTGPRHHSARRTKVLKTKTFYDCLELSVFPPDVTEFGLVDHRRFPA